MSIFKKLSRHEESRVNMITMLAAGLSRIALPKLSEEAIAVAIIVITYGLLLVALVSDLYVIIGSTIIFLAALLLLVFTKFLQMTRSKPDDERSARCSVTAARNGFAVALVLLAALTVVYQLHFAPLSMTDVLSTIWGICTVVYVLSYSHYMRVGC
ncbi:MAG TPA: hypothetical protein VK436_17250 [Methanocella sp.]|nr:hypothetical protein [Methanocella sp.]